MVPQLFEISEIVARITRGHLRDDAAADAVMVAPGDERRARGRAKRRGVKGIVAQTGLRQCVEGRCRNRPAEGGRCAEAHVIGHSEQDIRSRPMGASTRLGKIWRGLLRRAANLAFERLCGRGSTAPEVSAASAAFVIRLDQRGESAGSGQPPEQDAEGEYHSDSQSSSPSHESTSESDRVPRPGKDPLLANSRERATTLALHLSSGQTSGHAAGIVLGGRAGGPARAGGLQRTPSARSSSASAASGLWPCWYSRRDHRSLQGCLPRLEPRA